jgi:hypothetical protein
LNKNSNRLNKVYLYFLYFAYTFIYELYTSSAKGIFRGCQAQERFQGGSAIAHDSACCIYPAEKFTGPV